MKKKLLVILFAVSMTLTLAACGNDVVVENGDANVSTEPSESIENDANVSKDDSNDFSNDLEDSTNGEESLEDSTSEGEVSPSEPEVEVHEHAYVEERISEPTCTSVGLKKFTCECGEFYEEGIDMLSHDLGEFVYNNDATYEKDGTESASCKVCNNIIETRTKEGTILVKEPEPVVVPSGLDTTIGSELSFNGTVTSHNGVTINKLASFNKAGLYNAPEEYASNFEWCGYFNNDDPNHANTPQGKATLTFSNNLGSIQKAIGCDQGYTPWNDTIYFYFITGGSAGDLELKRFPKDGAYTISINYDMSQGWANITKEDGRDALLGLCSMISSTPSELENALYSDAFETPVFSTDYYTKVGDCQVKLLYFSSEKSTITYAIKP